MAKNPAQNKTPHAAEPDATTAWLTATFADENLSLAKVHSTCSELESEWEMFLATRVTDPDTSALHPETAKNYARYVRKYLEFVGIPEEASDAFELQTLTAQFFQELGDGSAHYQRAVRSVVLGQFLPWATEAGFIETDLSMFKSLGPVPYRELTLPMFEACIAEQSLDETEANNARSIFRRLLLHTATTKTGVKHVAIQNDVRELLAREIAGEKRIAGHLGSGQTTPPPTPYESAIEYIVWDQGCFDSYVIKLNKRSSTRIEIEPAKELIEGFLDWVSHKLTPEVIKHAASGAKKTGTNKSKKNTGKESAGDKQNKKEPRSLVYNPERRRTSFDPHLRRHAPERDTAVTALVKAEHCDFKGVTELTLSDVHVTAKQIEIAFSGNNSAIINETDLLDALTRYLAIRSGSDFKHLQDKDSFFFVSADGGPLVVDTDSHGKRSKDIAQIMNAENFLITHLLRNEDFSFTEVRETSIESLLERTHMHEATRDAVESYAQVMRVLPLGSAITPPPMGPGIAFPGGDGWQLTADE